MSHAITALRFHQSGNPVEVLKLEEHVFLPLEAEQVRLRILASPINPADINYIEGTYGIKPELPTTAGMEACGEVTASKDSQFQIGDLCLFVGHKGVWASEVQVHRSQLIKLPRALDPRAAAMMKVNPATAWQLLHHFTELPTGSWVIQNAANSGVGRCVIQLARTLGLKTLNLVRRDSLFDELEAIGGTLQMLDDAGALKFVKAMPEGDRPQLALNAVGGESALRLMNALGPNGHHITYGAMSKRPLTIPNGLLIFKNIKVHGFWVSRWIDNASRSELERVYGLLAEEILDGRLQLKVDSTFALTDYLRAFEKLAAKDRNGKVLFCPN